MLKKLIHQNHSQKSNCK